MGLLDGYYKVMSNIPKMGQLPTPCQAQVPNQELQVGCPVLWGFFQPWLPCDGSFLAELILFHCYRYPFKGPGGKDL